MSRIKFNTVTWYSKILSYLFIFGVFPVIVFTIGVRYYQTVEVLSYGYASASEMYMGGAYDKKSFQGAGSYEARQNVQGEWVNVADDEYAMTIKGNNMFYEKRGSRVMSAGSWMIRDSMLGTRFERLADGLYLQKNSLSAGGDEEILYYKILSVTKDSLVLSDLEKGKKSSFRKKD
jgi:hypothetical protein